MRKTDPATRECSCLAEETKRDKERQTERGERETTQKMEDRE